MIHHEKLYIQCYYRNNLFMHKGQDQVNFVEVYNVDTLNICMKEFGLEKIIFYKMTAVRT